MNERSLNSEAQLNEANRETIEIRQAYETLKAKFEGFKLEQEQYVNTLEENYRTEMRELRKTQKETMLTGSELNVEKMKQEHQSELIRLRREYEKQCNDRIDQVQRQLKEEAERQLLEVKAKYEKQMADYDRCASPSKLNLFFESTRIFF